jgi:hypothetical protein
MSYPSILEHEISSAYSRFIPLAVIYYEVQPIDLQSLNHNQSFGYVDSYEILHNHIRDQIGYHVV